MSDHNRQYSQKNRPNKNNSQTQNANNRTRVIIPAGNNVQNIFTNNGNFCLWFNKYTPIVIGSKDEYHTCNKSGVSSEAVSFYKEQYDNYTKGIDEKLKMLHKNQRDYLLSFPEQDYEVIELKAKTKTPVITGIGQPHPNEVSMVFDYMLGIPYIPTSSIKGLLRFTSTVMKINDNTEKNIKIDQGKINDESIEEIKYYFGGQSNEGSVVFLDAYPEQIPKLHIDIVNPHYRDYYQDGKAPVDYLEPKPIKFLTVAPNTTFIFRVIINKQNQNYENLKQSIKTILKEALTKEGIGAKTSLGYGIFKEIIEDDFSNLGKERKQKIEFERKEAEKKMFDSMSANDKLVWQINQFSNEQIDFNKAVEILSSIDNYQNDDKAKIAHALKKYFQRINRWEKQSQKQYVRVEKIKSILREQ